MRQECFFFFFFFLKREFLVLVVNFPPIGAEAFWLAGCFSGGLCACSSSGSSTTQFSQVTCLGTSFSVWKLSRLSRRVAITALSSLSVFVSLMPSFPEGRGTETNAGQFGCS